MSACSCWCAHLSLPLAWRVVALGVVPGVRVTIAAILGLLRMSWQSNRVNQETYTLTFDTDLNPQAPTYKYISKNPTVLHQRFSPGTSCCMLHNQRSCLCPSQEEGGWWWEHVAWWLLPVRRHRQQRRPRFYLVSLDPRPWKYNSGWRSRHKTQRRNVYKIMQSNKIISWKCQVYNCCCPLV